MKNLFFILLCVLFFISFTSCCLGTDNKPASLPTHSVINTTQSNPSSERIPTINTSDVPVLGSGSILTNGSFIAQIALRDKSVKEMLRHGSNIQGIIDFMPSRPKGWNLSVGPTLWIRYLGIDVYFYVNETGEYVERYEIVVPGNLYVKERTKEGTCILDKERTAVLAYNNSNIWVPQGNRC